MPTPPIYPPFTQLYSPPNGSMYVGARANPDGVCAGNAPDSCFIAQTAALETAIGRKLALNNSYHGWTTPLVGAQEQDDIANGRMPVVAWNCSYPNAAIAAGTHDADIAAQATRLKAFAGPVFLRFFWEFNLPDSSNGGRLSCYDLASDGKGDPSHMVAANYFSPTQYVAAWRHIHDVFAQLGVTNVVWLWCASANALGPPPAAYYPGDAYVDAVAFDNYDRVGGQSFTTTIATMYAEMAAIPSAPKPLYLTETAALPADQVAFLGQAQTALPLTYPLLKGIMYFDAPGAIGWSLTDPGSGGGVTAFAQLAGSSYLSAMPNLSLPPQARFRQR